MDSEEPQYQPTNTQNSSFSTFMEYANPLADKGVPIEVHTPVYSGNAVHLQPTGEGSKVFWGGRVTNSFRGS